MSDNENEEHASKRSLESESLNEAGPPKRVRSGHSYGGNEAERDGYHGEGDQGGFDSHEQGNQDGYSSHGQGNQGGYIGHGQEDHAQGGYSHDQGGHGGHSQSGYGSGHKIDMRILIPISTAGAIIGKGGKNIQEMRQEFQASIQIPDSEGFERVVCVSAATPDALGNLCGKIVEILKERPDTRSNDIRILIHKSQAGIIIGVKGYKIKELREITGANIKVFQDCCPNSSERVCQVRGERTCIIKAVILVVGLLEECPPKGQVVRYDPNNVDTSYEYGGYGGDQNNRDNNNFRGGSGYNRGNRGNNQQMPPNFPLSGNNAPRQNFTNNGGGGYNNQGDNFNSQQGFPPPNVPTYNGPANTIKVGNTHQSKVTIPTNLAGSIIGKGGDRIKQIRQDCGAKIKIDEPTGNSGNRIITIIGSPEQIQNAQYLLQQCVKLFSGQNY